MYACGEWGLGGQDPTSILIYFNIIFNQNNNLLIYCQYYLFFNFEIDYSIN